MSSYGQWLSAAGMKVNEHRQAVFASNLANMATAGFKEDLVVIRERRVASREVPGATAFSHPVLDGLGGGVDVRPMNFRASQGPIESTGRALDVAIQGEGYFVVNDGEQTRYTRNGQFAVNSKGELVSSGGDGRWRVLDEGNNRIVVDPAGGDVTVTGDGTILQGREVVGVLGAVKAAETQGMRKVGETLFDRGETEVSPVRPKFVAGAIEGSNVDVMTGLTSMIEVTRAYEMNANILRMHDQMTNEVVNTVGRLA